MNIEDGTDVDIFASQDILNPTGSNTGANGYKWVADTVNDGTNTKEILQICGTFGYIGSDGKSRPRDGSAGGATCVVASGGTNANCATANADAATCATASTANGVTGAANACVFLAAVQCTVPDANVKKGKMYVGVLAQLNTLGKTSSKYTIELKIDKCDPNPCVASNAQCEASTGNCLCNTHPGTTDPMWEGTDCSSPICPSPEGTTNPCSGNGDCVIGSTTIPGSTPNVPFCKCDPGYKLLNNTVCDLPADGQRLPVKIAADSVLSSKGFFFSSSLVGNEGTSLGLGKYQMYSITFPDAFTAVTVNVTGKIAINSDGVVAALSSGRPDMIVAATRGKGLSPNFNNIEISNFDYDGWVTRDLGGTDGDGGHAVIFRTTRPNEKWFVTVLSTTYSRSALDYRMYVKATVPSGTDNQGKYFLKRRRAVHRVYGKQL